MKSKTLAAVICILFTAPLFSQQTDSVYIGNDYSGTVNFSIGAKTKILPLITIKGEDFNRIPTNDFLEAMNGMFPWVYRSGTSFRNFTYVVDGNVLQDINGLSLHDIEEVSFTRANIDGKLFPFSQAGVFYIKTKSGSPGKTVVNFNTQYNIAWSKTKQAIPPDLNRTNLQSEQDNSAGHFQSNQLSVSAAGKKLSLYASGQLVSIHDPGLNQAGTYSINSIPISFNGTTKSRQLNAGGFVNLNYKISPSLAAGVSANYYHGTSKEDSSGSSEYSFGGVDYHSDMSRNAKIISTYYHVSPYIEFKKGRFQNSTRFEYANNEYNLDQSGLYSSTATNNPNPSSTTQQRSIDPYIKGFLLRNDVSYRLFDSDKFRATTGVVFSYLNQEMGKRETSIQWYNVGPPAEALFYYYTKQKITTLNPYIDLRFGSLVYAYAGHSFLLNKSDGITEGARKGYYTGATVDLSRFIKRGLDRLDISFHHSDMTKNSSDNYWLQSVLNPYTFSPSSHFVLDYNSLVTHLRLHRTKLTSVQVNTTFMNNRILLGAEWSKTVNDDLFETPSPVPPFPYIMRTGKVWTTGWALYSAVRIVDKQDFKWTTRLNALIPDYEYNVPGATRVYSLDYDFIGGLQNTFTIGNFFAQLNGMLGIDRKVTTITPPFTINTEDITDLTLNYVSLDYQFPATTKKSLFNNLSLFVHGRNLLTTSKAMDFYRYNRYGGIGLRIQLK